MNGGSAAAAGEVEQWTSWFDPLWWQVNGVDMRLLCALPLRSRLSRCRLLLQGYQPYEPMALLGNRLLRAVVCHVSS